jgi:ATP-dependent Clp protease ATP-binding subunit ClpC
MKFTPKAERAIRSAAREARELGHPCVSSQHLLLGLLLLGDNVQCPLLHKLGFTDDSLRQSIVASGPISEQTEKIGDLTLGASAARALDRAEGEAARTLMSHVWTEHILLGLLAEEDGGAARLFRAQQIDTARARQAVLDERDYRSSSTYSVEGTDAALRGSSVAHIKC